MSETLARLVVLVSGNGSNLQAILDTCADGTLPAQVVGVVANKPDAYGLERARQAGVSAVSFVKVKELDRLVYDARLADLVSGWQPDWVVLAGWMRLLSGAFLNRFPGKVLNLHPALPGAFPGVEAIERAWQAWQEGKITQTGVMVHLVPDEGVDNGPVLGVETVPIREDDTLEALTARIHETEHRLLVDVLKLLISKKEEEE